MRPYMFVINGIPATDNTQCEDISGAAIHIWVMSDCETDALDIAYSYIRSYHWEPLTVDSAFEIPQRAAS